MSTPTKQCTFCKKIKTLDCFHKHKQCKYGVSSKCKDCINEYTRKWRQTESGKASHKKHRDSVIGRFGNNKRGKKYRKTVKGKLSQKRGAIEARIKFPEKFKARDLLHGSIRSGKIKKRNSCEICYNSPTECHHEDYSKPLEFIELCHKCHSKLHQLYK